ncbi:hypothetical protein CI610_03168 [invertebrate metagenome]|uniref:Uncharacterized protein n=1 Tax=invertebrate metagenome TaxID=1711999 RepID=A0A2H9T3X5_9ZZZZ
MTHALTGPRTHDLNIMVSCRYFGLDDRVLLIACSRLDHGTNHKKTLFFVICIRFIHFQLPVSEPSFENLLHEEIS